MSFMVATPNNEMDVARWKEAHKQQTMKRSASTTSIDESPVSIEATFDEPIMACMSEKGEAGWLVSVGNDLEVMADLQLPEAIMPDIAPMAPLPSRSAALEEDEVEEDEADLDDDINELRTRIEGLKYQQKVLQQRKVERANKLARLEAERAWRGEGWCSVATGSAPVANVGRPTGEGEDEDADDLPYAAVPSQKLPFEAAVARFTAQGQGDTMVSALMHLA